MEAKLQSITNTHDLLQNIIYLMGTSFILGSFVSILLMLLLDYMHRPKGKKTN